MARSLFALVAGAAACLTLAQPPPGCPNGGVQNVAWNASAAAAWEARTLQNTSRSGRALRLLEPPDGTCLHGAGQDPYDFADSASFTSKIQNDDRDSERYWELRLAATRVRYFHTASTLWRTSSVGGNRTPWPAMFAKTAGSFIHFFR